MRRIVTRVVLLASVVSLLLVGSPSVSLTASYPEYMPKKGAQLRP